MKITSDAAVFKIIFRKGLADRKRLPISHVIKTLQEVDDLIREVGKQVQRERGVEKPDGDFGIELIAGRSGMVFRGGSIWAESVLTRDIQSAQITVERVLSTANLLESKKGESIEPSEEPIMRRFARISEFQRQDRTELGFEWRRPGQSLQKAVFGESGIKTLEAIGGSALKVESLTLYGKLRELKDKSKLEEEGKYLWGELLSENGEVWRIRFQSSDLPSVLPLFRKQIVVTGDATYFRASSPNLFAKSVTPDLDRDYVSAFDKYQGSDAEVFGEIDVQDLLKELRD